MDSKTITRGHVWAGIELKAAVEALIACPWVQTLKDASNARDEIVPLIEECERAISYYNGHGLTEDDMPESEVA